MSRQSEAGRSIVLNLALLSIAMVVITSLVWPVNVSYQPAPKPAPITHNVVETSAGWRVFFSPSLDSCDIDRWTAAERIYIADEVKQYDREDGRWTRMSLSGNPDITQLAQPPKRVADIRKISRDALLQYALQNKTDELSELVRTEYVRVDGVAPFEVVYQDLAGNHMLYRKWSARVGGKEDVQFSFDGGLQQFYNLPPTPTSPAGKAYQDALKLLRVRARTHWPELAAELASR